MTSAARLALLSGSFAAAEGLLMMEVLAAWRADISFQLYLNAFICCSCERWSAAVTFW